VDANFRKQRSPDKESILSLTTAEEVAHMSLVSEVAHTLALLSVLLLFLGACGLTRRLAAADRISFVAIVVYGFACVAVMIAGAVSGFIIPGIRKHMVRDVPAEMPEWQIVMVGIFQINQAFSRIFSVGAAIAIILWCVSALRNGSLGRGVAVYGCVVAALIIIGVGLATCGSMFMG
jgi:uncharacterized membrane protein